MSEKPVSRFWACFLVCFATPIVSLLWTQKMHKTRKWILINVIPIGITLIGGLFLDNFNPVGLVVMMLGLFALPVLQLYFLYRWCTEYNMTNFGMNSQSDWEKANENNI